MSAEVFSFRGYCHFRGDTNQTTSKFGTSSYTKYGFLLTEEGLEKAIKVSNLEKWKDPLRDFFLKKLREVDEEGDHIKLYATLWSRGKSTDVVDDLPDRLHEYLVTVKLSSSMATTKDGREVQMMNATMKNVQQVPDDEITLVEFHKEYEKEILEKKEVEKAWSEL